MQEKKWILEGEQHTALIAARIAQICQPGDVLLLSGALGMGKSVFARAFIRALTTAEEEVPSPTFTLLQSYESQHGMIYHFDLYRLSVPEEALELGIEDCFVDGICLVEWPERLEGQHPASALSLSLTAGGTPLQRLLKTSFLTDTWYTRLVGIAS